MIEMLMSMIGFKPVLSHHLSAGYPSGDFINFFIRFTYYVNNI